MCYSTIEEIMNMTMKRFLLEILGIQAAMFAFLEMCTTAHVIVIQAHLKQVQSIIFYANSLKQHKSKSHTFWAHVKVQRYCALYLFTSFNARKFKVRMRVSK
jgi:predicted nuclease of restriction endonuclease-like (RecB) superfamily